MQVCKEQAAMISLKTLDTFQPDDVMRFVPGYTSPEKYVVQRTEAPDGEEILIALRRVALNKPYIKHFRPETYMFGTYDACIRAGSCGGLRVERVGHGARTDPTHRGAREPRRRFGAGAYRQR